MFNCLFLTQNVVRAYTFSTVGNNAAARSAVVQSQSQTIY